MFKKTYISSMLSAMVQPRRESARAARLKISAHFHVTPVRRNPARACAPPPLRASPSSKPASRVKRCRSTSAVATKPGRSKPSKVPSVAVKERKREERQKLCRVNNAAAAIDTALQKDRPRLPRHCGPASNNSCTVSRISLLENGFVMNLDTP